MSKEMKYAIEYEHLKDEYNSKYDFKQVVEKANKYKLELSDEDFERFFKLETNGKDVNWIMRTMSQYDRSFIDALISMITW